MAISKLGGGWVLIRKWVWKPLSILIVKTLMHGYEYNQGVFRCLSVISRYNENMGERGKTEEGLSPKIGYLKW
jgi:hypothetical protein